MKEPLTYAPPVTLAKLQAGPRSIAVDTTNVYWANYGKGSILKVPIAGGTPTWLAINQGHPAGIAVDATSVYWTNSLDGTVIKLTPK